MIRHIKQVARLARAHEKAGRTVQAQDCRNVLAWLAEHFPAQYRVATFDF